MNRGDLRTLLSDYKKLEDNTFWKHYMNELDKERVRIAIDNAQVEGLTFERMKFNQGKYQGFHLSKVMHEDLAVQLKEKLEDIEANQ